MVDDGSVNDKHILCSSDDDCSGDRCAVDTPGFREKLLSSRTMMQAYAASVIILSFWLGVCLTALVVLSFFNPNQANIAIAVLGGPLLALILKHGGKAAATASRKGIEIQREESSK